MKERLKELLRNMQAYNSEDMCRELFGLDKSVAYDVLVVAPGWKPTKILQNDRYRVTVLARHAYISGYLVETDGLKIAWIQCASGACNLIDHLLICAELSVKQLIFVGAVGSLTETLRVGDLCTSSGSVAGTLANAYLETSLSDYRPFEVVKPRPEDVAFLQDIAAREGYDLKSAGVYCTDSISAEYSHLDEIRAFGMELIEMETASFYKLAYLFDVPAYTLLVVSDNSASGDPLIGRSEEQQARYHRTRSEIVPAMIVALAKARQGR